MFAPLLIAMSVAVAAGCCASQRLMPATRERAGGFDDDAAVLEDVLDRGADLVGAHEHDLVDDLAREPERLVADATHRDTVREVPTWSSVNGAPALQRLVHARGLERLDADDPHLADSSRFT